ncbi:MAG: peroxiredoxin [bacterium]|nr:peroxiredoxin [bacterium]
MNSAKKAFPGFHLDDQSGKTWTEKDLQGSWTVVYAYPKDMTPGCTVEAHEFSDLHGSFKKLGVQIFGLSPDDITSHMKFCEKDGITFPLLADTEQKLLKSLGSWMKKSMYGREYMGVDRSTWLVDPEGTIVKEWHQVKAAGHAQEVLNAVKESQ